MDATLQLVLRSLHVLGVILWVGGIIATALTVAGSPDDARKPTAAAARQAAMSLVLPGMLLAWIAGLVVLFDGWTAIYAKAPWMHTKVTLALVLTGLSEVLRARFKKAALGKAEAKPGMLRGFAIGILVLAVVVLFLVRLRPGG